LLPACSAANPPPVALCVFVLSTGGYLPASGAVAAV
jgi:hypothetical protein